jgi:CheY-like chemotaxis protein
MKEKGGVLEVTLQSIEISADDMSRLKLLTPGQYVQLTVSDTGSGIPKPVMEKIFEPFFTTKSKGEGTGMGLSLVYGIIQEMKGSISVYSEPGRGSTFQILIPEQADGIGTDENKDMEASITGNGRILVVDDEPSIVEWTSRMLTKLGYEVIGMSNGPDAVEAFKLDPCGFDLIITDLAMPRMTGLELSTLIKSERADIPIVLCTGFSEGLTSETLNACGISDVIMKPMIASDLSRIIRDSLNIRPQQD